jgi:hypothetical protein
LNLKTIHKKTHKQYTTNKYTNYEIFYLIHKLKNIQNRNFNFNGKVDAVSALKFSISDFAFSLICWEKLFNFLNSRGPPE